MEKYYCDYCKAIYICSGICKVCGNRAENKIWIEVQTQQEYPENVIKGSG